MTQKGKIYGLGLLGVAGLNLLAWNSVEFCDWYVDNIFSQISGIYARLTSLVPISIGEIMLILAVCLIAAGIGFFIFNVFTKFRQKNILKKIWGCYAWIALVVLYIMTLNCFIMYHTTSFSEKYLVNEKENPDMMVADANGAPVAMEQEENNYTKEKIAILRDYLVEECNRRAKTVKRDENEVPIYAGDLRIAGQQALRKLGNEYPQLSGFLPNPKYFEFSGFFSQQNIMGYYFPFSMEASINSVMYITNVAPTVCHELSHTKGVIYENEANMIAFLACINSDDEFVQYCGYLSVLNYVNNDFYESIGKNKAKYKKHVRISDLVSSDNVFLTKEDWQEVEKKAVIKTETVKKVSDKFVDTNLKVNGVEVGILQYNEVVKLLLDYYDGILY